MHPEPPTVPPAELREPARRVSPRAVPYWRLGLLLELVVEATVVAAIWWFWDGCPTWVKVLMVLGLVWTVVSLAVVPGLRYRVHRWEADDVAVYTREGWLTVETRVAPLTRVQTVDSTQGPVMRLFGLASLTVTTASAAGPITIVGLDAEEARTLVTQLTEVTGAIAGDAT